MNIDILQRLGLNGRQSTVYRTLLKIGPATISALARTSGLHRPVLYQILPELVGKHLISKTLQGKRARYTAEPPKNLLDLLEDLRKNLESELPSLTAQFEKSEQRPIVRYFEGMHGIRHAYEDLLATIKKGDVVYRYESPKDHTKYAKYIPEEYRRRILEETEVDWFIITNTHTFQKKKRRLGRLFKIIPSTNDIFDYDVTQFIYHDKVAFIDFQNEVATIIESRSLATFQKKIFKALFDRL